MKRARVLLLAALGAASAAGCDYARMTNDEALQTHEAALPPLPSGTVPAAGGVEALRAADPKALRSPVSPSPALAERGRTAYGHFCEPCHGPWADGQGTVGQSFAPLPTDLASARVQGQSDGELFRTIGLGLRRHPPLADTVSEADRWAVVAFLRTLPGRRGP